jgi:hypothetical protein
MHARIARIARIAGIIAGIIARIAPHAPRRLAELVVGLQHLEQHAGGAEQQPCLGRARRLPPDGVADAASELLTPWYIGIRTTHSASQTSGSFQSIAQGRLEICHSRGDVCHRRPQEQLARCPHTAAQRARRGKGGVIGGGGGGGDGGGARSSATRSATPRAAMRRGWVQTMRACAPHPPRSMPSSSCCGTYRATALGTGRRPPTPHILGF